MRSQPSPRVARTTRRGRGRRTLTAPARGLASQRQGFPVARESGREKPCTARMRRPPPCGPGNPHLPHCALGAERGNRLKLEWGLLRRGRGRERAWGLPQVPAPVVALATGRAGRSAGAAAASGKPGGSARAWGSAPAAGVPLRAPGGYRWGGGPVCGDDWRRWVPGKRMSAERGAGERGRMVVERGGGVGA